MKTADTIHRLTWRMFCAVHIGAQTREEAISKAIVSERKPKVHWASPGPDRWKLRSRTLEGIAKAMAEQWGRLSAHG